MSPLHTFVDESTRQHVYMICAATVADAELRSARKVLRKLRAPSQRHIHFVDESDTRRKKILTEMASLGVITTVHVAKNRDQSAARTAILEAMVPDLRDRGVRRLILDTRQGQDERDRSTIYRVVGSQPEPEFVYDHQRSMNEPLLWVPDAVAWAWGRGGRWKRLVEELGLVTRVKQVGVS